MPVFPQYRNILVPLDGSALATSALPVAASLAVLYDGSLTLVTVLPPVGRGFRASPSLSSGRSAEAVDARPAVRTAAAGYLADVASRLSEQGTRAEALSVVDGDPASEIVSAARDLGADVIVIATRGRSGIVRGLLGSVTDRVIHSSPLPVLVVPAVHSPGQEGRWECRNIIVPLDGSELAEKALPHAESIATLSGARVLLLQSIPAPIEYAFGNGNGPSEAPAAEEAREAAQRYLDRVAERLSSRGLRVRTHVADGNPRNSIVEQAEALANALVVMTTRGETGLSRWVVGSVADGVIRSATAMVLVVPPRTGL